MQGNFANAHATLDAAQALLDPDLSLARIRYLLERGRVFNSSQQVVQAQPLFQQAWELAQTEQQDFYAIDAAHMLAIIAPAEQQLEWNLRALTLAEQSLGGAGRCWRRMFVLGRKLVKGESLAPNPCVWDNRPIGTPSSVH